MSEEKVVMKGYKAFNKGMKCKDKQYAENTVFEEDSAEICKSGMHFCKNPLDCLDYYPLIDGDGNKTEFAKVEALDEAKTNDGEKFCTKKLKVGAKLSFMEFLKASLDVTRETIISEARKSGGDNAKLVGGYDATLAGGNYSIMVGDSGSVAKGKKGAVILLVERNFNYEIINFNAVQVDGEIIKEDTFYKLENGEFVEVKRNVQN